MKIIEEIIDYILYLVCFQFEGNEKEEICQDLEKIIGFMFKLVEVDIENVEFFIFMSDEVNVLCNDEVEVMIIKDEVLKNVLKKDFDYFCILKVLKK